MDENIVPDRIVEISVWDKGNRCFVVPSWRGEERGRGWVYSNEVDCAEPAVDLSDRHARIPVWCKRKLIEQFEIRVRNLKLWAARNAASMPKGGEPWKCEDVGHVHLQVVGPDGKMSFGCHPREAIHDLYERVTDWERWERFRR